MEVVVLTTPCDIICQSGPGTHTANISTTTHNNITTNTTTITTTMGLEEKRKEAERNGETFREEPSEVGLKALFV